MITMELPPEEKKKLEEEEGGTDDDLGENYTVEKKESVTGEKKQEEALQTTENQEEAPQAADQKQDNVLNLNNEVVKMRKEVKRVRALIIRKLTRQIGALKKKKGKDAEIERNQRRAARLLEEIHAIKALVPDVVTKTALQKNLNFEQVCKDPKSTISDRAIARIATHPQFSKKIEAIKAAVKAFKDERSKEGKHSAKLQKKADKIKKEPQHTDAVKESKEEKEEDKTVRPILSKNNDKMDIVDACHDRSSLCSPKIKVEQKAQKRETPQTENKNKKQTPVKSSEVKDIVKTKPFESEEKTSTLKLSEISHNSDIETESELEVSDDDEKEYFDDSTEERFHKQSSGESEESDNDFFVGKVSKFKKKKKIKNVQEEKVQKTHEENSSDLHKTDNVQSELDELESRLKSKAPSLKSVFCSSLAGPKQGKGAGKGDGKFGGQGKQKDSTGGNKDFSKQSKFQKQFKGKAKDSGSKYSKPCPGDKTFEKEEKGITTIGRGRGQAREHVMRQKDARGRNMFSHQAPQPALHPSWEASKKRKEQQGQILAFQGKKIKFDDDD